MLKADLLIKNVCTVTMNKSRQILDNASIAILGDKIIEIGDSNKIEIKYTADKVINGKGKVVFPGFVSTHTHLFQVLLKGLGRDKPLIEWLDSSVRRAIWKIDKEGCYYAALVGCIEAIRTGTTTILDYMYCHGQEGLDDSVMQALEDIGVRGILGRGHTKTNKFPKEYACKHNDTEEMFFDDVKRLALKYHEHSRLSVAMAPGIIWDLSHEGFIKARDFAKELGLLITMHLVETEDDDEYSLKTKGMRTIPYLEKVGILAPNFLAVHCVHMTDEDITLFKKYDVKVSHCPISNMILASGTAPIPKFMKAGVNVSLAVDGAASNDTQDMLEVIKMTALKQKLITRNANIITASDVLEMATLGGAKALLMEEKIGSLEVGKKADMFIYNPISAKSIPINDPISTLVYSSGQANIETSIIDGRVVMENGRIANVDEEEILYKTQEIAAKLLESTGLGNIQWKQSMKPITLR
jgi:5-methylthioadenosine/S-adenosylhomocysteine deaminase